MPGSNKAICLPDNPSTLKFISSNSTKVSRIVFICFLKFLIFCLMRLNTKLLYDKIFNDRLKKENLLWIRLMLYWKAGIKGLEFG